MRLSLIRSPEFDRWLTVDALFLSLLGVVLIYSATHTAIDPGEHQLPWKQLLWLPVAFFGFFAAFFLPLRLHEALAYVYYAAGAILLAAVLILGETRMGATRWFAFGTFNLQPSELAKITAVFGLARLFAHAREPVTGLRRLVVAVVMILLPVGLILRQPDLGTALVFCALGLAMLFWSGLPLWHLALLVSPLFSLLAAFHWITWALFFVLLLWVLYKTRPGFLFGTICLVANLLFGMVTPLVWNRLHDYQKMRILIFLDPGRDPQGAGYQLIQAKVAIGSGGIFGKGFLHGSQTKLAFLPAQHTDFIFTVVGEEFGLLGVLIVLALLGFLVYRGLQAAIRCRNQFASYVALGLTSILAFQILVNVGMAAGLMPVTGLPLPFLSYGGTSLLTNWVIIGLLANIAVHWQDY